MLNVNSCLFKRGVKAVNNLKKNVEKVSNEMLLHSTVQVPN